jgi:hypothetical protein
MVVEVTNWFPDHVAWLDIQIQILKDTYELEMIGNGRNWTLFDIYESYCKYDEGSIYFPRTDFVFGIELLW